MSVIGVVLAGGASRRMGRDKTEILIGGRTLAERARLVLDEVTEETLSSDRKTFPDGPGRGPAAGILGAAAVRPGADLLVLACDMPQVTPALLSELVKRPGDWVVPRHEEGVEPLCALYRPAALEALRRQVESGRNALHILEEAPIEVCYLEAGQLAFFGRSEELFMNLNTPEDLESLRLARPAEEE